MIKKILAASLVALEYLCIGTVCAQLVLFSILYLRGGLTPEKRWRISAVIAGADVEELRKEIRVTAVSTNPGLDAFGQGEVVQNREGRVDTELDQLEVLRSGIRLERQRYEVLRSEFSERLNTSESNALENSLIDLKKTFEVMETPLAREQLLWMIQDGGLDDVVSILQEMNDIKKAKILAEFVQPGDAAVLHDLLMHLREDENSPDEEAPTQ